MVSNKTPFAGEVSSRRRASSVSQALSMWLDRSLAPSRDGQNPGDRKITVGALIKERRSSSALGAPDSTAVGSGQRRGGTRSPEQR